MIVFGIIVGVVSVIGIVQSARLVSTDGHGRVPTEPHASMLSLR